MKTTWQELKTKQTTKHNNLFNDITVFQDVWNVSPSELLTLFDLNYNSCVLWLDVDDSDTDLTNFVDTVQSYINITYKSLKYKYNTLVATTKLDYNPIWNVDGTETTTATGATTGNSTSRVSGSNSSTTTNTNNSTTTVANTGSATDAESGTNTDTINGGKQRTNVTYPNGDPTQTVTNKVVPMDSTAVSLHDTSETVTTNSAQQTETETVNAGSQSTQFGHTNTNNHTDNTTTTINGGSGSTVQGSDSHTDTVENSGSTENNTTTTRQGNIGVTTTQKMINEERQVADFNIINMFLSELANKLFLNTWR